ncbi:MAG: hypothetical protein ACTSWY_07975, partial [Promethearchaeota archaeon]
TGKHYLINSDCNGAGNIIRLAWSKGREIKKSDITPLNINIESDLEKLKSTIINKKLFKTFGQMDEEPFTRMNNQQINKLLQRPQIIEVC